MIRLDNVAAMGGAILLFGGVTTVLTWAGVTTAESKKYFGEVNGYVANDLGVRSFITQTLTFDKSSDGVIKFTGTARDRSGNSLNFAEAYYKLSKSDEYNLIKLTDGKDEYIFSKNENNVKLFKSMIAAVLNGEFLGGQYGNVSVAGNGQIITSLSAPQINEEKNTISYSLNLLGYNDSYTEMAQGELIVTTQLTKELKQNPMLVYEVNEKNCTFKTKNVQELTFDVPNTYLQAQADGNALYSYDIPENQIYYGL